MGKMYLGKCKQGFVIYGAIADTPLQQAGCASDIRSLIKRGFTVELVDFNQNTPKPVWCFTSKSKSSDCRKCDKK